LGMPMVWSADHYRINVLIQQHFPIITVDPGVHIFVLPGFLPIEFVHQYLGIRSPIGIHVANRNKSRLIKSDGIVDIVVTGDPATTDLPDIDLVARGVFPKDAGWHNSRKPNKGRRGQQGIIDKFSSFHIKLKIKF